MKRINLNVVFTDPIKTLKESLSRSGAKEITVRRTFGQNVEVRYVVSLPDPKGDIGAAFSKMGAKNVRVSESYDGARFEIELPDIVDEKSFKRNVEEAFRRTGFRIR